jgi:hypothetical protein
VPQKKEEKVEGKGTVNAFGVRTEKQQRIRRAEEKKSRRAEKAYDVRAKIVLKPADQIFFRIRGQAKKDPDLGIILFDD